LAARIAATGGNASRNRFRTALSNLNIDLGGYTVRFNGTNKRGSTFVDVVVIDRNGHVLG
jgi:hypothetical protein